MSEYDRQFARRHITWKLTNVTRESLDRLRYTPNVLISLGDNKTEWVFELCKIVDNIKLYLTKEHADRDAFSVKISAAIIRMKPIPTCVHFLSFSETMVHSDTETIAYNLIPLDVLFDEKIELLDGSDLTLELKLELMEQPKVTMETSKLSNNFKKLTNDEKYSDFEFICSDGKSVHVHKAIIATQCEAFANMIEAGLSETKTNSAKIADIDSETMTELVRFLYCRRVEDMKEVQERLVVAANKYRLDDLKNICISSLMESLTDENVVDVFEIADLLGEEHLKNNCIDYINCHQFRLQNRIEETDFPKKLLWAFWKSTDLHSIRILFKNGEKM